MFCLFILVGILTSQPPAPTPSEPAQQQQYQTTHNPDLRPEDGQAIQKGAVAANTPFPVINVVIQNASEKAEQKSSADWWRGWLSSDWWLVGFTGALVFVSVLQWRALSHHAKAMSGILARVETDSEGRAKEFETQTCLAKEQLQLALNQFSATFRPEIRIHTTRYIAMPAGDGTTTEFIGITLLCFNEGSNIAAEVKVHADFLFTNDLGFDVQRPLRRTYQNVESGKKMRIDIASERQVADLRIMKARVSQGQSMKHLHCVGWLAYFDNGGVRRETGFHYVLNTADMANLQWDSAGDKEREYEF